MADRDSKRAAKLVERLQRLDESKEHFVQDLRAGVAPLLAKAVEAHGGAAKRLGAAAASDAQKSPWRARGAGLTGE